MKRKKDASFPSSETRTANNPARSERSNQVETSWEAGAIQFEKWVAAGVGVSMRVFRGRDGRGGEDQTGGLGSGLPCYHHHTTTAAAPNQQLVSERLVNGDDPYGGGGALWAVNSQSGV